MVASGSSPAAAAKTKAGRSVLSDRSTVAKLVRRWLVVTSRMATRSPVFSKRATMPASGLGRLSVRTCGGAVWLCQKSATPSRATISHSPASAAAADIVEGIKDEGCRDKDLLPGLEVDDARPADRRPRLERDEGETGLGI